ncbi:MAG: hypothetical protein ACI9Y1_003356 [Lentisphaeria bacterium]|jgi:hypothetical protein
MNIDESRRISDFIPQQFINENDLRASSIRNAGLQKILDSHTKAFTITDSEVLLENKNIGTDATLRALEAEVAPDGSATTSSFNDYDYENGNFIGRVEVDKNAWQANPLTQNIEFPDVQMLSEFDPSIDDFQGTFYAYTVKADSPEEADLKIATAVELALTKYLESEGLSVANIAEALNTTPFNIETEERVKGSYTFAADNYRFAAGYETQDGTLTPTEDYVIKGISWSPYSKGDNPVADDSKPDYMAWVYQDAALMQELGINTVKTYFTLPMTEESLTTLDVLYAHGIGVVMTVYANDTLADDQAYRDYVDFFKDHPSIKMWLVGNEFNYNNLFNDSLGTYDAVDTVNAVIAAVREVDPNHAIAASWGYFSGQSSFPAYANRINADVFALNVYSGTDFEQNGDFFNTYASITDKPVFISEYGADSYHTTNVDELPQSPQGGISFTDEDGPTGYVDEPGQADALKRQADDIGEHLSAYNDGPDAVAIGGTPFSWNDEWWKSRHDEDPNAQNQGGFILEGGTAPPPDLAFNEEYFGIVDIDRNPKEAFFSLQEAYQSYDQEPIWENLTIDDKNESGIDSIVPMRVPTSDKLGIFTSDSSVESKLDLTGQTDFGVKVGSFVGGSEGESIEFTTIESSNIDGGEAYQLDVVKDGGFSGIAIEGNTNDGFEGRFDLSNYENGTLRVSVKGDMENFDIQIRHTELAYVNGSYSPLLSADGFGYQNDGEWHDLVMPLSTFGDDIDWEKISSLFTIVTTDSGSLEVDNIYYDAAPADGINEPTGRLAQATFESEEVAYSNVLYTYDLDENGKPKNFRSVVSNSNDENALGRQTEVSLDENGKPLLMLLPNRANSVSVASEVAFSEANVIMIDGQEYQGHAYFSHSTELSSDHKDHFHVIENEDGSSSIYLEDLYNIGDGDFNDMVLRIEEK